MDSRPIVLLVDDEPYNLDYLEQELEERDLEILTAANGKEALALVAERQPDMIFLDIMMPEMNGFEVLKCLKADALWNVIPVVIISAVNDMASVVKGIEMGAEDFLPKPFNPVLLHARLNAGLTKKRLRDLERQHLEALQHELEIARKIQAGFLPRELPQPPGWDIAAFFRPAHEVAGDFYDVFPLEDEKLGLLIGDVTDKGVGSAMYMALFRSLLRAVMLDAYPSDACAEQHVPPEMRLQRAVSLVNDYICTVHQSPMFATLVYGVLDTRSGQLTYVNGGHDLPYLVHPDGSYEELCSTGPLVGAFEGVDFTTRTLQLQPGDLLVLFSDGITDAQNNAGTMFMKENWRRLLQQPVTPPQSRIDRLVDGILTFIGDAPQYDDITLVTVQRL